ncbi:MAG: SDR family NAD(P)-dependent oxidoreductase [Reichenbachiella sp.]
MKLTHNKILITGGTRGIGLAMALQFLALGNKVIVSGKNKYALNQLKELYPDLITYQCDLSVDSEVHQLVKIIGEEHPDLSILINNAGVQYSYELYAEENIMYKVNEELSTNLIAPIGLTTGLLPVLIDNPNCAVVNISSALGFVPKQSAPIYCTSKSAMHMFTKVLRYQLEEKIKVFEVIPTLVDTDMTTGRGANKISPKQFVDEFLYAFEKDQFEINIGKVKILRLLHRLFPKMADRMMRHK